MNLEPSVPFVHDASLVSSTKHVNSTVPVLPSPVTFDIPAEGFVSVTVRSPSAAAKLMQPMTMIRARTSASDFFIYFPPEKIKMQIEARNARS